MENDYNLRVDNESVFEFYLSDYKFWHKEYTGEVLPEKVIEKLAADAWLASSSESHIHYFNALKTEVVIREIKKNEDQKARQEKPQISEWHKQLGRQLPRCIVRFLKRTQAEYTKRKYYLSKYPQCLRPYIKSRFCYNHQKPALTTRSAAEIVLPKTETKLFPLANQQDDNKEEETIESKNEMPLDVQVPGKEEVNHSQKKQPISKWQKTLGPKLPRCIMRFLTPDRKEVAYGMRKYYLPLYPRFHKPQV